MAIPNELGMTPMEIARAPWPVEDGSGFKLAIAMLKALQAKGRHDPDYVQYDTVRKMQSAISNAHESSAGAASRVGLLKGNKGKSYRITTGISDSKLFQQFMLGMES